MGSPRFVLLPIVPVDYPTITKITIDSFAHSPFHYATFLACVPPDDVSIYRRKSKIEYPQEGEEIQTINIVDMATEEKQIVACAIWKLEKIEALPEPRRPPGSNFKFIEDFRKKSRPLIEKLYDKDNDIELSIMRVLTEYQGKGLGSMLLKWGMKQAEERGRRIFLYASSEGRALYQKFGFEVFGEVEMQMGEYGGEGVYVESLMI